MIVDLIPQFLHKPIEEYSYEDEQFK